VVGQLLFGQFGAWQQAVLYDGSGEGLDDVVGGGCFHVSQGLVGLFF
jgi:hypothetical protein